MDLYVVVATDGALLGVFTKEPKALFAVEHLKRDGVSAQVYRRTVNQQPAYNHEVEENGTSE